MSRPIVDYRHQDHENNEDVVKSKLQEKDDALVTLSDQVMKLMAGVQELKKNQSQSGEVLLQASNIG